MRYFARGQELAHIKEAVSSHKSSGLIVRGPAGSGKSTLIKAVAKDSSIEVIRIKVNRAECRWPLSGLSVLLSHFDVHEIQEMLSGLGTQELTPHDLFGLSKNLLKWLGDLSDRRVLLLIDDVDRMDAASKDVIGFIFRRLSSTNVSAVISLTHVAHDCPFEGLPFLDLEPLDQKTIQAMTMSEVEADSDTGIHRIIARAAAGIPGRAMDMLRGLTPGQITGVEAVQLPFRLSDVQSSALLGDLDGISPDGRKLLQLAAMSTTVSLTAVSAIIPHHTPALDELYANEYLVRKRTGMALRSPALRSALYWSMTGDERHQLSEALAAACTGSERVWHESFLSQDPETSAELFKSARDRLRKQDVCGGIEMAERACALQFPCQNYSSELASLAESFAQQGELVFGRRYTELAGLRPANKRVKQKLAQLKILFEFLENGTVPDYLATAASQKQGGCEDVSELRLLLAVLHLDRWELEQAKVHLETVRSACTRKGLAVSPMHQAAKNLYSMLTGEDTAETLKRLDVPLDDYLTWEPGAIIVQSVAMTYAERYETGRKVLNLLISRAATVGPLWVDMARLYQVKNDLRGGNTLAALTSAKAIAHSSEDIQVQVLPRTYLKAWYWCEQGDHDRTTDACNTALERAAQRHHPRLAVIVDGHYGAMLLHRGETNQGLRRLLRSYESLGRHISPQAARVEPDLVEALVTTGDIDKAKKVLETFHERAAKNFSRWCQLVSARMEALVACGEESLALFEKATAMFEATDSKFEAAKTLSSYADRLSETGYTSRAKETSAAAATLFDEIGLKVWAQSLRGRTKVAATPSGKHHVFGRLTESQREVAELVVAGYRNKEIAATLFTSVRTIEVRLTGIYREIGVKSRSQLIAASTGGLPK